MTVIRNGEVVNTLPVTTGKAGFHTRNGIKVCWRTSTVQMKQRRSA